MTSNANTLGDVRQAFLDYFKQHGHEVVSSGSLVPHNDPTLMFSNAGMNQFKDVFTGKETRPYSRATTAQKCVRAGGKHNDLDNVGYTARHHTFFEMMGNFSFGDYFKEEAIFYGWNLVHKVWGLPADKLCVTVFDTDDEAFELWKKISGLPENKIIRNASLADNFWSMGDTGPCGPCSEIFYDHGAHIPGGPPGSPDEDGDRYVEIWNLVFMQYDQVDAHTRVDLPKPCIDTGMGLERMAAILQGVHNNYDIDLFKELIAHSKELMHNNDPAHIASHRVIADHMRSSAFLMADGVLPSNEGRGYVLRRIMRRAMRHAHMLMPGSNQPLLYQLVPTLVSLMGDQYPELERAKAVITENLRSEEERFKQTLERGLKLLDEESETLGNGEALKGDVAFKLYDTYGFPLDLTQDILRGRGMTVDVNGFDACMEEQKTRARGAHKGSGDVAISDVWFQLKEQVGACEFVGYDVDECEAFVTSIVKDGQPVDRASEGDEVFMTLDKTPFYGESGGQVGDVGQLSVVSGQWSDTPAQVTDTQKPLEDFIVHRTKLPGTLSVGDKVIARIDTAKRNATRANHSATHLVHKALRDTLGEHVTQKGSLVDPEKLRFDFSHGKAVTPEEIAQIEAQVNQVIMRGGDVGCEVMAPEAAIEAGAMALFGEKYGDEVRVLSMGAYDSGNTFSVELCGGTHVHNTADIGAFKLTSEGSVAAGIRRIEAVTGEGVRTYAIQSLTKQAEQLTQLANNYHATQGAEKIELPSFSDATFEQAPLAEIAALYKQTAEIFEQATARVQEATKQLQKKMAAEKAKEAMAAASDVTVEKIGDVNFAAKHLEGVSPKELRPVAETMLKQAAPGVVMATAENDGKVGVVVAVSPELSSTHNAVDILKLAVETLGGKGGGGKPEFAQGGAADASKLDDALSAVKEKLSA